MTKTSSAPTSKEVTTAPTGKTTQTIEPPPSRRSETLALAVFGTGAILLLAGLFAGKIQEITLPGGAGIKLLSDTTTNTAKLATSIKALEDTTVKQNKVMTKLGREMAKQNEAVRAEFVKLGEAANSLSARMKSAEDRIKALEDVAQKEGPSGEG